ncbi:putative GLEYA domain-containing protein [Seiridium unicorne]|uniref:GLEYA domain-containing protein n=1 Tax=Seiridium unicorne TaxID=138068 RepID=A0ABR2UWA6_9PEZI
MVPSTVTGNTVTDTTTTTLTTTTDVTTTETATVTETTTQTTSTSTLTCLNSVYTASTPVGTIFKRGGQASKPTCIPSSWPSTVVSSACSCLSIPTPSTTTTLTFPCSTETDTYTETSSHTESTTTTTTTTLTAYAEATTIASNGIAYRKYTHSYDANSASSGFTSSTFKSLTSDWSGVLQSLTFSIPNWPSGSQYLTLADHSAFLASQAALVLQGFFIAQETGTYTFTSSKDYIDNWGYLWTGDASDSTWSDSNTAYQASRTGAGYTTGTTTVTLNAGDAIPLAFLWANGGGVGESYFTVTTPSGSSTTDTTGYFVQACSSSVFA